MSFLFFLQSWLCTVSIACGCFCTAWFDFVTVFVSSLYGARIELVTCQSSDTTPTGVKGSMSCEILAWKWIIFKLLVIASLHKNLNIMFSIQRSQFRFKGSDSKSRFKGVSRFFFFLQCLELCRLARKHINEPCNPANSSVTLILSKSQKPKLEWIFAQKSNLSGELCRLLCVCVCLVRGFTEYAWKCFFFKAWQAEITRTF